MLLQLPNILPTRSVNVYNYTATIFIYVYDANLRSLQTNRHEKAQQEREQKVDILQHELQKEMDAKLQKVHSILKHENEMKFNASKPEKDE